MIEIREGRGCDGPWGSACQTETRPSGQRSAGIPSAGIPELSRTFAHVDPVKEPIPVIPTCHYMMGGIPTKVTGQVVTMNEQGEDVLVPGLFAVGEIACVSVHGCKTASAVTLSLDLVVFGRSAGLHLKESILEQGAMRDAGESDIDAALARLNRWNNTRSGEDPVAIRKALQSCMQHNFGIPRRGCDGQGLEELKAIKERLQYARLDDTSSEFNTQRIECLELDNLMENGVFHCNGRQLPY